MRVQKIDGSIFVGEDQVLNLLVVSHQVGEINAPIGVAFNDKGPVSVTQKILIKVAEGFFPADFVQHDDVGIDFSNGLSQGPGFAQALVGCGGGRTFLPLVFGHGLETLTPIAIHVEKEVLGVELHEAKRCTRKKRHGWILAKSGPEVEGFVVETQTL